MLRGLLWVDFFFMFMFAMLLAVPRRSIIRLLPVGFIGGFGQSVLLLSLMVPILGWWQFRHADIFSVAGMPLFSALGWAPVVIIYAYFLNRVKNRAGLYWYMAGFSLATALFVHWLYRAGYLVYVKWSSLFTIPVAFLLISPITYYVLKARRDLESFLSDGE